MFNNMITSGKSSKKNEGSEFGRRFIELQLKEMPTCYSPFESPHILRKNLQPTLKQEQTAKQLFKGQWDKAQDWQLESDVSTMPGSQQQMEDFMSQASKQVLKQIAQSLNNPNVSIQNSTQILNSQYFYKIGFNEPRYQKYPDTPGFKMLLKDPFVQFQAKFRNRIDKLKSSVIRNMALLKIEDIQEMDPVPLIQQYSYRYFIMLADKKKSQQAYAQANALYKLALYLQPYDEVSWDTAIKLLQQCGDYKKALTYTKCALLTTKSQIFTDRYLRLRERACEPLELVRGLPSHFIPADGKQDKFFKMLYQLSRCYYVEGHIEISFKLLYYIVRCSEANAVYLPDIARLIEAQFGMEAAYNYLLEEFSKRIIKVPGVYLVFIRFCQKLLNTGDLVRNLEWIAQSMAHLAQQNRWKIYLDIGTAYFKLGLQKQAQAIFAKSIECAPPMLKIKVYILLYKLAGKPIPESKVPAIIIETNKQRFMAGQPPKIHTFSDWKYYFHYNLFYIYQNDQAARKTFEKATEEWPASGRLLAQRVFSDRIKKKPMEMLEQMGQILKDLPKSGQLWCQCGRMFVEMKKYNRALKCFQHAMFLTPQYGDSFIEGYKVSLILGKIGEAQQYRRRVINVDPTYGNVWSYLKFADSRCSTSQNWQRACQFVQKSLARGNTKYITKQNGEPLRQLTAIDEYNDLIDQPEKLTQKQREYLFFAYDQIEPKKN